MAEILVRLKNYGSLVVDSLEANRNVAILHTAINVTRDATGKESRSRGLTCVTEDKPQRNIVEGFAQNIKQIESSFQTNKRKRKRDDDDDFDYLYGIVTTTRDWHFLLYTPGIISQGESIEYQTLRNGIKKVLGIVVGLLKDRACAEREQTAKPRYFSQRGCQCTSSAVDWCVNAKKESSEEKKMDSFLDEVNKKKSSRPQLGYSATSSEISANLNGGEVPSEDNICGKMDSKCKKEKDVDKLKQELFVLEITSHDIESLKKQNHVSEIFKTGCSRKSSIDKALSTSSSVCNKAKDSVNQANYEEILYYVDPSI
ncbi:hypothetical protein C1645_835148 [Glomus cerebriforme]|uniref:Uncharacterized protein n=1 Tax=Glomus cerebriforme TaxID=658196 RepID=A0A397S9E7_9GLOM|nr:hypothetical protein C1645_835148 [Glomus cerebriforme]